MDYKLKIPENHLLQTQLKIQLQLSLALIQDRLILQQITEKISRI